MKQKLFFLLYSMNVGGVEKSLLGLLSTFTPEKFEIHVGLLQRKGGYLQQLPEHVILHACCEDIWDDLNDPPLTVIFRQISKFRIVNAFLLLFAYIYYKFRKGNMYYFYKTVMHNEPIISIMFDKAFAYAGPAGHIDCYINSKIRAKEKYGWIHFDVKQFGIDKSLVRKIYKNYSKIYIVSEQAKQNFDEIFPEFIDKTEVRYNIVSREQCLTLAKSGPTYTDSFDGKRILTVGRLSKEKGQDVTIEALKILVDKGYNVKWYYVGEGDLLKECQETANRLGVSDKVSFLGLQTNPYGYMRDCDIYMQPSRHEGYCITLAEARCFSSPIVATNFTGAREQLSACPQSVITGMSAHNIAEGVMCFL